eukprot:19901-Heterococcus_DN1.PRE.5
MCRDCSGAMCHDDASAVLLAASVAHCCRARRTHLQWTQARQQSQHSAHFQHIPVQGLCALLAVCVYFKHHDKLCTAAVQPSANDARARSSKQHAGMCTASV